MEDISVDVFFLFGGERRGKTWLQVVQMLGFSVLKEMEKSGRES